MGWTGMKAKYYYKNGMINRKKECDELIEACPDDYKLIKSALIGICYYAAVRMLKKAEQPVVGIVIKTTVRMKEDLNFLYKWVSEDMGPADTYCPDNILDELSEADSDWAKNWRAECKKCNERKQKLSAMPVGSEIKVTCEGLGKIGYVANSSYTVMGESMSAGRVYDKIGDTAYAKVVLVTAAGTLCKICKKTLKNI